MSRVKLAAERLQTALQRLEDASVPLAKVRDSAGESVIEMEKIKAERDRLIARVAELEENAHALSTLTGEVETRLDAAIAEIRAALGR